MTATKESSEITKPELKPNNEAVHDRSLDSQVQCESSHASNLPFPSTTGPPDGGYTAWLQCASGFCVFFNTWGLLASFGAFQSYYKTVLLQNSTSSQISWIGTVQSSSIFLGALYAGPLYDRGYIRSLTRVGSFMIVFGMLMTSFCKKYWHFLLAQGILMGIGLGCLFIPLVTILATYFQKRRGVAMGIASSGSAIGGIVYPIVFYKLVPYIGFGWTVRSIALVMFVLSIIPVFGLKMRVKPPAVRSLLDLQPWREPAYTLFAASVFLGYLGLYVPYFYLQLYCYEKKVVVGELNFYLLPVMNAGGLVGRVAYGKAADVFGPLKALISSAAACTMLLAGWIGAGTVPSVIVIAALYGFFSSGLIILPATAVAVSLCPDLRQYSVRITMQMVPAGLGLLLGNPIAGACLGKGWISLQTFSISSVSACMLCLLLAQKFIAVGKRKQTP